LFCAQEVWVASWAQSESQARPMWVHTYTWLTAAVLLVGLSRAVLCFHCCLDAAKRMHGVMTARVLRAPLAFFHANPTGRVLNRFSKDLGVADEQLPNILFDTLQCGGEVLGTVVSCSHLTLTPLAPSPHRTNAM
jgi:ATP-binding cassette subfamily C (CFTR/MRP) protein 4